MISSNHTYRHLSGLIPGIYLMLPFDQDLLFPACQSEVSPSHRISYLMSEESTLPFGTQSNLFLKVVNASLCGRSISKPYNDFRRKWL